MVSAGHPLVKFQPALLPPRHCLVVNDHSCWIFREVRSAQQAEFIQLVPASIGSPKHSVRSASGHTTPGHAAPRVPFLQRRITSPHSVLAARGDTPRCAYACPVGSKFL